MDFVTPTHGYIRNPICGLEQRNITLLAWREKERFARILALHRHKRNNCVKLLPNSTDFFYRCCSQRRDKFLIKIKDAHNSLALASKAVCSIALVYSAVQILVSIAQGFGASEVAIEIDEGLGP